MFHAVCSRSRNSWQLDLESPKMLLTIHSWCTLTQDPLCFGLPQFLRLGRVVQVLLYFLIHFRKLALKQFGKLILHTEDSNVGKPNVVFLCLHLRCCVEMKHYVSRKTPLQVWFLIKIRAVLYKWFLDLIHKADNTVNSCGRAGSWFSPLTHAYILAAQEVVDKSDKRWS